MLESPMPEDLTTCDLLRVLLQSQLESNRRQATLEEVVIQLSTLRADDRRQTSKDNTLSPSLGIDLTRFCTSDGPIFKGPYQDTEVFLRWFTSLKAFFRKKGVILDFDQITLVGNFIHEPTVQTFYEGAYEELIKESWEDFVGNLFTAALPVKWEDKLYEKIQHIHMSPYKDFKTYSAQARSIQNLINYNDTNLSDNQLTKYVEYGMIDELKATVQL